MPSLLELDPAATAAVVERLGGRAFHARIARQQVFGQGVLEWSAMSSLPLALREALASELPIVLGRELERRVAPDRAIKFLTEFPGEAEGNERARKPAAVESVHLPSSKPTRGATLCVSSQAGCPVGCPFCASGKAGLQRNLRAAEILEQYVRGRALGPLSRSVVMGMGEPLLNFANVQSALETVHAEMGIGARSITVSTVGFPARLNEIARQNPRFELAISLHTPDQEQRDRLVPAMAGVPIEDVLRAADDWFEQTGREPTYEIALLGGENDSLGHARRLAARLARRRASVNLIPYNPVAGEPWRRPSPQAVEAFRAELAQAGVVATVRWSKGVAAEAACGQLRLSRAART